jgi:hypothetical protein
MALAAEKAGASQQIDWGSFELFFASETSIRVVNVTSLRKAA